jgi:hypothetical protein
MLSNVLAFDVRVFDPDAIIRAAPPFGASPAFVAPVNAAQFASDPLQPGDPGYPYAVSYNFVTTHSPYAAIGTGAFVDLGYGFKLQNALQQSYLGSHAVTKSTSGVPNAFALLYLPNSLDPILSTYGTITVGSQQPLLGVSRFAGLPTAPLQYYTAGLASQVLPGRYQADIGCTWDSWTLAYERDGINQDTKTEPAANQIVDEGTDGLDNDGINGVDDAGERETVPPYAYPLRGVQIRIRLYEPGTRQARQATVENDFISE